jgi:hypothetical protein
MNPGKFTSNQGEQTMTETKTPQDPKAFPYNIPSPKPGEIIIFAVMTMQRSFGGGFAQGSFTRWFRVPAGAQFTRAIVWDMMIKETPEDLKGGVPIFFLAESNEFDRPAVAPVVEVESPKDA